MRRTKRQTSQENPLPGILGLLCAEQNVGNLKQHTLSGILGLLCAEQNVGNLQHVVFSNCGTPMRRTKRQKSENKCTFRTYGTPVRRTTCWKYQKILSCFFGLQLAEQNVINLKKITFRKKGTPGSRILDPGSWILDAGYPGSRISWIQDPGSNILDPGSWIMDPGSCSRISTVSQGRLSYRSVCVFFCFDFCSKSQAGRAGARTGAS